TRPWQICPTGLTTLRDVIGGLAQEIFHLAPDIAICNPDIEGGANLAEERFIAGLSDLELYQGLAVLVGGVSETEQRRYPRTQQRVAARQNLELQLFVMSVLLLEALFPFSK